MLLGTIATVVTGLIGPTSGEWEWDLVGDLTDDHATGGALGDLQAETGQQYPDLEAKRQAVVDAWRGWQRALFKSGPWANYEAKLKEFASALETQLMAVSPAGVSLGGFFEQFKAMSPIVWVFIIGILIMTVTLVAFRKPKRR